MPEEYTLAERLKNQFRDRGASVSGMQASSTSELLRRAEMGKDPRVNCAEQAFRENYSAMRQGSAAGSDGWNGIPQFTRPAPRAASRPGYGAQQANASRKSDHDTLSEDIVKKSPASRAKKAASASREEPYKSQKTAKKAKKTRRSAAPKFRALRGFFGRRFRPTVPSDEVPVTRRAFPFAFITVCIIGALAVFTLVNSMAKVYETSSSIAEKERTIVELEDRAESLRLKLDVKNDLRNIRDIAVNELGMTEEDPLQRCFVSISEGERIEVLEAESSDEGQGGVLFSAIGALLDRIR